jgi:hypothetical protein
MFACLPARLVMLLSGGGGIRHPAYPSIAYIIKKLIISNNYKNASIGIFLATFK